MFIIVMFGLVLKGLSKYQKDKLVGELMICIGSMTVYYGVSV